MNRRIRANTCLVLTIVLTCIVLEECHMYIRHVEYASHILTHVTYLLSNYNSFTYNGEIISFLNC